MQEPQVKEVWGSRRGRSSTPVVPPQQARAGRRMLRRGFILDYGDTEPRLTTVPAACGGDMGARRLRVRSQRSRDSPVPTQCNQTECFDPLLRNCVSCELFHTPDTGHTSSPPTASSLEPGTALQPQEGSGLRPDVALLFGAPALLGLVLALTLVGLVSLVSWRWRQQLRMVSSDTSEGVQQESLENVFVPSSEALHAAAPTWPPLKEDADNAQPCPGIPVPATELGSTELVTTKTAGPEP